MTREENNKLYNSDEIYEILIKKVSKKNKYYNVS